MPLTLSHRPTLLVVLPTLIPFRNLSYSPDQGASLSVNKPINHHHLHPLPYHSSLGSQLSYPSPLTLTNPPILTATNYTTSLNHRLTQHTPLCHHHFPRLLCTTPTFPNLINSQSTTSPHHTQNHHSF